MFSKRTFRKEVEKALEDGVLTDEEMAEIESRREELDIDEEFLNAIRIRHAEATINPLIDKIFEDERVDDEEIKLLRDVETKLKLSYEPPPAWHIYRKAFLIERGNWPFTVMQVPIRLLDGEECYHTASASWLIQRPGTAAEGFVNRAASDKVVIDVGASTPGYNRLHRLARKAVGVLYITNKRVVFSGDTQSAATAWDDMIEVRRWRDAVEIHKSSGSPDLFAVSAMDMLMIDALVQAH